MNFPASWKPCLDSAWLQDHRAGRDQKNLTTTAFCSSYGKLGFWPSKAKEDCMPGKVRDQFQLRLPRWQLLTGYPRKGKSQNLARFKTEMVCLRWKTKWPFVIQIWYLISPALLRLSREVRSVCLVWVEALFSTFLQLNPRVLPSFLWLPLLTHLLAALGSWALGWPLFLPRQLLSRQSQRSTGR